MDYHSIYKIEGKNEISYEVNPDGHLSIKQGSTELNIMSYETEDCCVVYLAAPVSLGITRITPKLTRYLLEENFKTPFGKFCLDSKHKQIWYMYSLLGDFLDDQELLNACMMVASIADDYDEKISEMAKGKRAIDF